ncbi:hypothetical protein D3C72_1752620 [compost metagenome]
MRATSSLTCSTETSPSKGQPQTQDRVAVSFGVAPGAPAALARPAMMSLSICTCWSTFSPWFFRPKPSVADMATLTSSTAVPSARS